MIKNSLKNSSMARITEMLSNTKNPFFEDFIMDLYILVNQVAEEKVRKEIQNLKGQISIDAFMNGKPINNKVITEEVLNTIIREMF